MSRQVRASVCSNLHVYVRCGGCCATRGEECTHTQETMDQGGTISGGFGCCLPLRSNDYDHGRSLAWLWRNMSSQSEHLLE
eukprot:4795116-Pleurochrysis_carterae.AAC.3